MVVKGSFPDFFFPVESGREEQQVRGDCSPLGARDLINGVAGRPNRSVAPHIRWVDSASGPFTIFTLPLQSNTTYSVHELLGRLPYLNNDSAQKVNASRMA